MIARNVSTQGLGSVDFSFRANATQRAILQYVRTWLPLFLEWIKGCFSAATPEDDLSRELNLFFQRKAKTTDLLFNFDRKKGSDFSVRVDNMAPNAPPIFLMEAKRLPPTSTRDYVHHHAKPGGISRFKLEKPGFGDHLAYGTMIGYVQKRDFDHWFKKVNSWVDDLIESSDDSGLKWNMEDRLVSTRHSTSIAEYHSCHSRITKAPIRLTHFWLNVTKS